MIQNETQWQKKTYIEQNTNRSRESEHCATSNVCNGMSRGEARWREAKIFEEIGASNLVTAIKLQVQKAHIISSATNRKVVTKLLIIKLFNTNDKEKISNTEKDILYRKTKLRIITGFLPEAIQTRRHWCSIFKVLKKNVNVQLHSGLKYLSKNKTRGLSICCFRESGKDNAPLPQSSYYMQLKAVKSIYKTNLRRFRKIGTRDWLWKPKALGIQRIMRYWVILLFFGLSYLLIEAEQARNSEKLTGKISGLSSRRVRKMGNLTRQTPFIC